MMEVRRLVHTVKRANDYISKKKETINPQYRQKYHLQPPIGWMNDPNGVVTIDEEHHVFYQYYPYDSVWGPMHWGHSKTRDGINWKQLPVALAPDKKYDEHGCFSGTSVYLDDQLTLMYTGGSKRNGLNIQQQCLAQSKDLISFEKSHLNPVISFEDVPSEISLIDFRDPKIIKREDKYYTLIVTKSLDGCGQVVLFQSKDKTNWQYKSIMFSGTIEFGEMWECPDLFSLNGRDVLIISAINMKSQGEKYKNLSSCLYFVGSMDWDLGKYTYDYYDEIDSGLDFYAPQVTKKENGEQLLIAWMQMWDRNIPSHDLKHGWAGCMTLMRKLEIINDRLIQKPYIPESSIKKEYPFSDKLEITISNNTPYFKLKFDSLKDFQFVIKNDMSEMIIFSLDINTFTLSRKRINHSIKGKEEDYQEKREWQFTGTLKESIIEIFIDTSSIEVFIGGGQKTMSMRFYSEEPLDTIQMNFPESIPRGVMELRKFN